MSVNVKAWQTIGESIATQITITLKYFFMSTPYKIFTDKEPRITLRVKKTGIIFPEKIPFFYH